MYQTLDIDLWFLLWSTLDVVCDVDSKDIPQLRGLPDGVHISDEGWMIFSKPTKELPYLWKRMLCRRKVRTTTCVCGRGRGRVMGGMDHRQAISNIL